MTRNGNVIPDSVPPPTPRNAMPPGPDDSEQTPRSPQEIASAEWGAAVMREIEALRASTARVEFETHRSDAASARAEAAVLAMGPVLGRVDTELETMIAVVGHPADPDRGRKATGMVLALQNVQQTALDLRADVQAVANSVEALACQHKGDMAAMRAAFDRLAGRVDDAEDKADETGKHFAPLARAAAASLVDDVEARKVRRTSLWRIVVGVSLALAGAGCSLLVQHCGGG